MIASTSKRFKQLLSSQKSALHGLTAGVEALREEVRNLEDEPERLLTLPHPQEAALEALTDWLDSAASDALGDLPINRLTTPPERLDRGPNLDLIPQIEEERPNIDLVPVVRTLMGLLVAANRTGFENAVRAQLENWYAGRVTIAPVKAKTRVAAIDAEILQLELQEEAAIRSAEASGAEILRRANAPIEIVLAAASELPR